MTNEEAIARIKDHKIVHKINEPRAIYISEALDLAIKALEHLRWIPCSERLPESGQKVLCACRAGIYDVFTYLKNERGPWYKDDRHVYMMGFVTHWMPLPELHKEPYKEERDGY